MTKWRFGIVGAGMIAEMHARAILDLPDAEVVGICDGGSGRSVKLTRALGGKPYPDYETLIADNRVNVITVATPSGAHMEPAVLAAKLGKHVLCEKPLEVTLPRIDKMISAHSKAGTYLGGIFPYRYNGSFEVLKKAVRSGRFGRITFAGIYVPWWRDEAYYQGSWHGTWSMDGGGALMNQSIHMVDTLVHLMGPVAEVQGFADHLVHEGIEAEDTAVASLRFENGALGLIHGTTASFPGQYRRLEITGSNGTVIQEEDSFKVWQFRDETSEDAQILKRFSGIHGGGGVSDPAAIPYENHTRNIAAFLTAIEDGKPFEIDGVETRKAVELILRIYGR